MEDMVFDVKQLEARGHIFPDTDTEIDHDRKPRITQLETPPQTCKSCIYLISGGRNF